MNLRVLAPCALVFLAACSTNGFAAELTERTISVSGEGNAYGVPDMAVLNFSVRSRAETAGAAFKASSRDMNAVIAAFKKAGIEARDLQTADVNLNPVYAQNDRGFQDRARIVAFEGYQTLTVRLRDIETAGEMIDLGVSSGANELQSFALTIDDAQALEDEARVAAVKDARRKAELLAEAAGTKVGEVITINAQSSGYRQPIVATGRMVMAEAVQDEMKVEAGEQQVSVSVQITFALN
ncbi:MAG: SIMPL domain-containing protein [Parvularcula sp.]|jgi:uncharacterized protein YggE|nr:SIMPL domain-containing protein [Parvularcula sp.]